MIPCDRLYKRTLCGTSRGVSIKNSKDATLATRMAKFKIGEFEEGSYCDTSFINGVKVQMAINSGASATLWMKKDFRKYKKGPRKDSS